MASHSLSESADLGDRALLDGLSDVVVVAGADNTIRYVNAAVTKLLGWQPAELVGQPLTILMPAAVHAQHLAGFTRYVETGEPRILGRGPVRVSASHRDGHEVEIDLALNEQLDESGGRHVVGVLRDAGERLAAERQASLARYLAVSAEVAVALSTAGMQIDLEEAAPLVLPAIGQHLGWPVGTLWVTNVERTSVRCAEIWSQAGLDLSAFEEASYSIELPPGGGLPGRVWVEKRPIWLRDVTTDARFTRAEAAAAASLGAAFAFPVINNDEVLGVIEFFAERIAEPDDDLLRAMSTVGSQIGQFLGRRMMEQESQARLAFLARATGTLDASLDYATTLAQLARICVPFVADLCAIDVLEGEVLRRVASAAIDPVKEQLVEELRVRYELNADRPSPPMLAVRTGETQLYSEPRDMVLRRTAVDAEHAELVGRLGVRSGVSMPLRARGRILGAISFGTAESGRTFDRHDLAFLEELAARAALALDNARLFTERSYIARRLQDSLLPSSLPTVPGLEIAARYVAAAESVDVGGDFFEVFPWGDDQWLLAVGDVCGKGVEAAALTGLVRHALRALALRGGSPAGVLRDLNTVLLQEGTGERFCTICLITLRITDGGAHGLVSTAGHPPPAVVRSDRTVEYVGAPGTLVGLLTDITIQEVPLTLFAGDTLVLYTDGVIERRNEDAFYGEERLSEVLRRTAGHEVAEIVEQIERSVVAFDWHELRDDMALLAVRIGT